MIVTAGGIFVLTAVLISRRMDTMPLFSRLMLAPPDEPHPAEVIPGRGETGPAVGDVGVAHTPLRPGGKGRFGERAVDVMAMGDFLDRGTPIRVVRVTGNQVFVETVEPG
jgi:hypothetical protein